VQHEIVPAQLVESIAKLKHGGTFKCLKTLLRHKLVHHEGKKYDGYRLTSLGYDFLAIRALTARGSIAGVGRQIGVGKESDVYEVVDDDGRAMALKLHRLGRTSFRAVKSKRDYVKRGNHFSWLYLSRLAALKEFAFMKALGENGMPVPEAIECNRHAVLMSLVNAQPMVQMREFKHPEAIYKECMGILSKLARLGLVHCDFNEFNLFVDDEERVTLIDFPQMISTSHANADELFDRDVQGVVKFFERKFGGVDEAERIINGCYPTLKDILIALHAEEVGGKGGDVEAPIDRQLRASGWVKEHQKDLQRYLESMAQDDEDDDSEHDGETTDIDDSPDTDSEDDGTSNRSSSPPKVDEAPLLTELESKLSMQAHVQKKVIDQRKLEARRQYVAKASRNAMKSKNKGKRKGEACGNKPLSASDGW
jgi:RIO kinase 2